MNILVEKFGPGYEVSSGADTVPIQWVEGLKEKDSIDRIYLLGGLNLWTDEKPWSWAGYTLYGISKDSEERHTYWSPNDIFEAIKNEDIDVIHAHTRGKTLNNLNVALKSRKKIPLIYTVHGVDSLSNPLDRELFEIADVITAPSPYVADLIKKLGYGDKVMWVPNSTDFYKYKHDEEVKKKSEEIRKKYAQNNEKLILITGRLQEDKGVYELAEAICELVNEGYNVKMIHAGIIFSEGEKDRLTNIFRSYGLESRLVLLGKIPEDDPKSLAAVYKAADVFILPSDGTYENCPMSALEALAMETPTIVSMVGGPKSVFVDYGLALGVKPRDKHSIKDAIRYYLDNEEKEIKRAKTASKVVEMFFSTEFVTDILVKLYTKLTQEKI